MSRMIICIDFDGVIHAYSKGWQDGSIYDNMVPGFATWAAVARSRFRLVIYSSRSKTPEGIEAMRSWLRTQLLRSQIIEQCDLLDVDDFEFASEKPPAFLTIDDRAVQFSGDWGASQLQPDAIAAFKPWTQAGVLADPCAAHDASKGTERAAAMRQFTALQPYPTEEYRFGHRVLLVIGCQSFVLSDGVEACHENREAAEWVQQQLSVALANLVKMHRPSEEMPSDIWDANLEAEAEARRLATQKQVPDV